jgi:hypothetical protein
MHITSGLMDVMERFTMRWRVSVSLELGKNFGLGVRNTVVRKVNDIA